MTPEAAVIEQTFSIVNKTGQKVPFVLNPVQLDYDSHRTSRDLIVKARQQGFSSFIEALIVLRCLSTENLRAVLIAHDRESTEKLFDRARFFINNLGHSKQRFSVDLTRSSRREFYFTNMNSTFYIGTAGSESFGRGDTINLLHCSEVAMWPDPRAITAGLFQAVPRDGTIWLESTANGRGNWFHLLACKAQREETRFMLHFYGWWENPEYSIESPANMLLSPEEQTLATQHNLTLAQLAWRREKISEMDDSELVGGLNLFPQEYPASFEEAFLASGLSVFSLIPPETSPPTSQDRFLTTWREPTREHSYILGVDVSAGVGADRSVIWGLDCEHFEQCFEWASDCVDPEELAYTVGELGQQYNLAWIAPELNNHGLATIDALRRVYPASRILQRYQYDKREAIERTGRLGWLTTEKSKSQMITNLRKACRDGLRIYSDKTKNEMSTFTQSESGRLEAQAGCYDDRVIVAALAVTGYKHLYQPKVFRPVLTVPFFSFNTQRKQAVNQFVDRFGTKPSDFFGRRDTGFVS